MLWAFFLVIVAVSLESLTCSPFLATRFGVLFGLSLGGKRLDAHLYEVPVLPAFGFKAVAQTWGETVLVIPESQHLRYLATLEHEACHTKQYRRYTSLGFWLRYLGEWLWGLWRTRNFFQAYVEISLEREARRASQRAP